ncbi:uncharacterized protein [Henckelia pumila]|uniref:uncharacterized protein n=1 Tax=Henckelia pumila TaxID=405737 RepID=UPI003C6E5C6B
MRLLTSEFEKLRMEESEAIMQYNTRLKSLANEASVLGDPISNEQLVCKLLRSVPKRFHTKVCAIDESKDTSIMVLDKLISSLRTYKMEMEVEDDYKGKSIGFQVSNDNYNDFSEIKQEVKEYDLGDDSIALITKKFGDYLKQGTDPGHAPVHGSGCPLSRVIVFFADLHRPGPSHGVIMKNIYLKYILWKVSRNSKRILYSDWIKRNKLNTTLSKENAELKVIVARLKVLMSKKDLELGLLNNELEKAKTTLSRFNSSSNKLDSLLTMDKYDRFGFGFKNIVFEIGESSKSQVFVKEGSNTLNHPSAASQANNTGNWYFDSGSSRHMTGLKHHLTDYIEQIGGRVTYGGGAKGRIVGKRTLNVEGFPKLHNVLHVQD